MNNYSSAEALAALSSVNGFNLISTQSEMKEMTKRMLRLIGENPDRQGLAETPARFSKALSYLTSGYTADVKKIVGNAIFDEPSSELVFINDIEFFSLCEHHMLPFFGKVHVAYVPAGKVIGLSKIPRIVDVFSRRLQVQERLTNDIAVAIEKCLDPKGVAVIIEASHLCMMMRGVEKQSSKTLTKTMLGDFRTDDKLRADFLTLFSTQTRK